MIHFNLKSCIAKLKQDTNFICVCKKCSFYLVLNAKVNLCKICIRFTLFTDFAQIISNSLKAVSVHSRKALSFASN
jgi:hypothetical protein